jgi:hypothetical protein
MSVHTKRPKPYTLNHWVVGSIPTRCMPEVTILLLATCSAKARAEVDVLIFGCLAYNRSPSGFTRCAVRFCGISFTEFAPNQNIAIWTPTAAILVILNSFDILCSVILYPFLDTLRAVRVAGITLDPRDMELTSMQIICCTDYRRNRRRSPWIATRTCLPHERRCSLFGI